MIDGIKATADPTEIERQTEEEKQKQAAEEKKEQEDKQKKENNVAFSNKIVKHNSVSYVPNTVKHNPKRAYSPLAKIAQPKHDKIYRRPFVIGICGGPSSGKSSIAKVIQHSIPSAITLNQIHFYNPIRGNLRRRSRADSHVEENKAEEETQKEIREVYRQSDFDSPDAIDWNLLIKGVAALKRGDPFNRPIYDDETMIRTAQTQHIKSAPVIIIEGHLIFCNEQLMKLMDLKVFIDTDDDVRLSRKVLKIARKHPDNK